MKEKKIPVALLIALIGFPQISETIYTPSLPNIVNSLITNAYLVEATLAIYFLGFALGVLVWGIISDWSGRRIAMLTGLVLYGIGTIACGQSGSIEELLSWRFIQAFGASVGSVVTQTILRDAYIGNERTKIFSTLSGALAFSPAIGPFLGGIISEFWGWRANFWFLAAFSLVIFVWSYFFLPETMPKKQPLSKQDRPSNLLSQMMTSRVLWGHILLIGATNSIIFGFYQEAPFVFIEQLGIKPSHYGLIGILISLTTLLAARFSFTKSHQYPAEYLIRLGTACVTIGSLAFTITVLTGIFNIETTGLVMGISTLFFIFFGIGLIIPNSLSIALKPYQNSVGTAGSIFGGCYYIFIASCTWLMSYFHNGTSLPLPLYITCLAITLLIGSKMVQYSSQRISKPFSF